MAFTKTSSSFSLTLPGGSHEALLNVLPSTSVQSSSQLSTSSVPSVSSSSITPTVLDHFLLLSSELWDILLDDYIEVIEEHKEKDGVIDGETEDENRQNGGGNDEFGFDRRLNTSSNNTAVSLSNGNKGKGKSSISTNEPEILTIAVTSKYSQSVSLNRSGKGGGYVASPWRKNSESGMSDGGEYHNLVAFAKKIDKDTLKKLESPKQSSSSSKDNKNIIFITENTLLSHSRLFGQQRPLSEEVLPSLLVTCTRAIPLSSVILIEDERSHSDHDQRAKDSLMETLYSTKRIIREGEHLTVGDYMTFTVAMTEPVLQGVVRRNYTKVILLPPTNRNSNESLPHRNESDKEALSNKPQERILPNGQEIDIVESEEEPPEGQGEEEEDDDDDVDGDESGSEEYDIDESFLANSVLAPPPPLFSPSPSPLPTPTKLQTSAAVNGSSALIASDSPQKHLVRTSGAPIVPKPLSTPITSDVLVPRPPSDEDDSSRIYLRTHDLGKLGVFSGDWLVLSKGEEQRLARVFAAETVLGNEAFPQDGPMHGYLPPLLFHNVSAASTLLSATAPATGFTLHPSRLRTAPLFPVAHSVTVARIASPHSVNRTYQNLFLEGLKIFFQEKKRVLKKGDLIGIGICEEEARFTEARNAEKTAMANGGNAEGAVNGGSNHSEGVSPQDEDFELPSVEGRIPNAVVYFQITSLDLIPPTSLSSTSGAALLANHKYEYSSSAEEAVLDQLEMGQLGCVIDPKVTKLVQTGLERSLVPDVKGFLGLAESETINTEMSSLGEPTPASRLFEYITACLLPSASEYDLHLTVLIKGASGSGKRTVVRSIARKTGFHLLELDCFDLLGETDIKTEGQLRARIEKAISCSPCMVLLQNIEALARKSQALETGQEPPMSTILSECFATARQGWKSSGFPVIILATTCDVEKVPTGVLGLFKEEIGIEAPGESERLSILRSLTKGDIVAPDVSLRALAVQTAALVANDLVDLVRRARCAATERVFESIQDNDDLDEPLPDTVALVSTKRGTHQEQNSVNTLSRSPRFRIEDVQCAGLALTAFDFNSALEQARNSYSESIGAPKIPNVTWDDVGGLANVKSDILDTIQLPLEHPELFADGLKKRSGILLYGPPGTGKTLLAKAVATSCSLNFFSVKGPELLNMYIGESEANVRRVFQRARDAKPCVIFFDELDSVAPKRGNQGDSGGVMDRIVSQLLAELDGMAEGKGGNDVFVIGATNRPDLLDPALLRPGRFDRMLYLGVSDTHSAQLKIIQALTRKFKLDPLIDLQTVAESCPFNYTGADFYALCSDAMLKAMTRKAEEIDTKIAHLNTQPPYVDLGPTQKLTPQYYLAEIASAAETAVLVSQVDFEAALSELVPSVSRAEMEHYKVVQERFSGSTMNSQENINSKESSDLKNKAQELMGTLQKQKGGLPLPLPKPKAVLPGNDAGVVKLGNGQGGPKKDSEMGPQESVGVQGEQAETTTDRKWKGKGKAV